MSQLSMYASYVDTMSPPYPSRSRPGQSLCTPPMRFAWNVRRHISWMAARSLFSVLNTFAAGAFSSSEFIDRTVRFASPAPSRCFAPRISA